MLVCFLSFSCHVLFISVFFAKFMVMEEIDEIIIHSLRQIGCDIEDDGDSIGLFSTEQVIEAAVKCLEVIQPGLDLPHLLPPSMSARYRLGTDIAQACKDIGYRGDIGYQTFLYSSEPDVRRILMFLIEKLPKESEKSIVEASGKLDLLESRISKHLNTQLSLPWVPTYCKRKGVRWSDSGMWFREGYGQGLSQPFVSCGLSIPKSSGSGSELSQVWKEYFVHYMPIVLHQVKSPQQLIPSIISFNSKSLLSSEFKTEPAAANKTHAKRMLELITQEVGKTTLSKASVLISEEERNRLVEQKTRQPVPTPRTKFEPEKVDNKPNDVARSLQNIVDRGVEKQKARELEIEKAREDNEELRKRLENLQVNIKKLTAKLSQTSEESMNEEKVYREKKERCTVKKRTYDLLPEADVNLSKLQSLVENSSQKLVSLAAQWEKHRVPLLQQYRNAKQRNSNKVTESKKQADAVQVLREKARDLAEEAKSKEQLQAQLTTEYEKVTKDINRSAYTRRIMEIIGNIRKQKEEIHKVIKDTRELQKEINNLTGMLDRSFTVADELIFRDARRDETARRAYKLLASLHSDCAEVVQMVEETGAIIREIRDLQDQIETERAKNVGANLERITADLQQMKQESAILTAQLQSLS